MHTSPQTSPLTKRRNEDTFVGVGRRTPRTPSQVRSGLRVIQGGHPAFIPTNADLSRRKIAYDK